MRDITTELKELRLHGMAGAWADLTTQEGDPTDVGVQTSRWLIEHLLQAEHTQRAMASVRHQMKAAKFPLHRDLAGFDFEAAKVDQKLVKQLSTLDFTDTAQNAVLIGGPGTGKTHLATAIGVSGIAAKGKRVRFYSTVDLVNELEKEKREGTRTLCKWILDHLGSLQRHSLWELLFRLKRIDDAPDDRLQLFGQH